MVELIPIGALAVSLTATSGTYFIAPRAISSPSYEFFVEMDAKAKSFESAHDYIEEVYTLKDFSDEMIKDSRGFTAEEAAEYTSYLRDLFA